MVHAIAVVGTGPVGSAAAYHLAQRGVPGVVQVDGSAGRAAFRQSGGSVSWHRPDPVRSQAIEETARFIRAEVASGAPIRIRDEPYLYLDSGELVDGINIEADDLVAHLRRSADGVADLDVGEVRAVEPGDGSHRVVGTAGEVEATVVLLALGAANVGLSPGLTGELEKRQLLVLDLPVEPSQERLPHVIARLGPGFVYVFVKEIDGRLRLVVGQEDIVADDDHNGPVDYLPELFDAGLAERFPFLAEASTAQVRWGTDWAGKDPHVHEPAPGLISVNCGSAVRSCIAVGRAAADAVVTASQRAATTSAPT